MKKGTLRCPFCILGLNRLLLLLLLLNGSFRSGSLGCGSALFLGDSLHGELDATTVVGFENLDADDLTFLDVVFNLIDALLGDLRDVQQAILARQNLNDGTEVEDLQHGTFVDLANLDFCGDRIDTSTSSGSGIARGGGDSDRAVVLDVDGGAGFLGDRTKHDAALTDHVTDLLRIDLEGVEAR